MAEEQDEMKEQYPIGLFYLSKDKLIHLSVLNTDFFTNQDSINKLSSLTKKAISELTEYRFNPTIEKDSVYPGIVTIDKDSINNHESIISHISFQFLNPNTSPLLLDMDVIRKITESGKAYDYYNHKIPMQMLNAAERTDSQDQEFLNQLQKVVKNKFVTIQHYEGE